VFYLLGLSITLAFLLIVNMTAAVAASLVWRAISGFIDHVSVRTRAKIIFGLRTLPIAIALIFVLAFIVPAYLLHEPEDSGEVVSTKLAFIAMLCSIGVTVAVIRVLQTWLSTRRLMKNWLGSSTRIEIEGIGLPIHRISHQFPVLAVVGVFRPRIFVAEMVLASLADNELRAAIAHEYGHLHGRDNLKRTVLRICRDLVILPIGKGLDLAWAQNAEAVADEFAARADSRKAIDLASALVKITRIVPQDSAPSLPVGAYIITDREGDIASRVRRLLNLSDRIAPIRPGILALPSYVWSFGIVLLLAIHFTDQRLLLTTHKAIEHFVWIFQ
jgi:Zn-dependent protease with chaperone function